MVIDTSALLAALLQEPDAGRGALALEASLSSMLSAASLLEASIVIESRKGEAGGRELDLLIEILGDFAVGPRRFAGPHRQISGAPVRRSGHIRFLGS